MARLALASLWLLGLSTFGGSARAWGPDGHTTVGWLAQQHIRGTQAAAEVRKLLRPGETLARATVWADTIKGGARDEEARDYVAKNPEHGRYHYTDVPFQVTEYRVDLTGADPQDLVHLYSRVIKILRGTASPAENPTGITPRVALLLLAHFAGDLQQPWHIGASYIADVGGRQEFIDPAGWAAGTFHDDFGGNGLIVGPGNMHYCWDVLYLQKAMQRATGGVNPEVYGGWLMKMIQPKPAWGGRGEPETWPFQWATAMLPLCREAHEGIKLGPRTQVPNRSRNAKEPFKNEWHAQLPSNYDQRAVDAMGLQMAQGGWRLAQILLAIWPEPNAKPAAPPAVTDKGPGVEMPAEAPKITTELEARRLALARYPDLGVAGSALNTEFLARRARYLREKPLFFQTPDWPLRLADECAGADGTNAPRTKKEN